MTFSGAELDLKTAPCIREALAERTQNGLYGYTLPDEAYLDSLRNWLRTEREWEIRNDWIVPTYSRPAEMIRKSPCLIPSGLRARIWKRQNMYI